MDDVTRILQDMRAGDDGAENRLADAVYGELRAMAAGKMAAEKFHTIQPTELVNEAYIRLGGDAVWENRRHFFGAASEAMRRVLIDRARRRARAKRGGGDVPIEYLESHHGGQADDDQLLQVHEVLELLEAEDSLKAGIVKMRFFVGLNNEEIASAYGLNEKTIRRHWNVAKVRLFQLINEAGEFSEPIS